MTVFTVYTHDHTGEDGVMTFASLQTALAGILEDIDNVETILREDGHEPRCVAEPDETHFEVYVPDTDIYYEWTLFKSEIRN